MPDVAREPDVVQEPDAMGRQQHSLRFLHCAGSVLYRMYPLRPLHLWHRMCWLSYDDGWGLSLPGFDCLAWHPPLVCER